MTTWEDVINAVEAVLRSAISYADVTKIGSAQDYIANNTAQALVKDFQILLSTPDGESQNAEPMISGLFRKRYDIGIVLIAKTEITQVGRLFGSSKKGIFEVQADIVSALEHKNLNGLVDNKAGTNFEVGWTKLPSDNKAITAYSTIYTVIKTER
jgi:hypothetical protein